MSILQEIGISFRNENASLLSELTVRITFKVFLLDGRQDLFRVSIDTLMPSGKKDICPSRIGKRGDERKTTSCFERRNIARDQIRAEIEKGPFLSYVIGCTR